MKTREEVLEARLLDAQHLLRRMEFLRYGSKTRLDERPDEKFVCQTCGYPEPNHEPGCSLNAVLHGEDAPRLKSNTDRPESVVVASGTPV